MDRGRRGDGPTRRQRHGADDDQAIRGYRRKVLALHRSEYVTLRQAAANVPIAFAVLSTWMIALGDVTSATLAPLALMIVGGGLGVGYHAVQNRPGGWRLLAGAAACTTIGLAVFVVLRATSTG